VDKIDALKADLQSQFDTKATILVRWPQKGTGSTIGTLP
jgi:hypothetical protein